MRTTMPVLFVSHGAPTLLLDGTKAEKFFKNISENIPKPKGILVVSGHWEEAEFAVSTLEKQETIYDFYGFPQELYEYKYEPKGDLELANKVVKLLEDSGVRVDKKARGLDHGAWVPLVCMYPDAEIPVTQLALKKYASPEEFLAVGEQLKSLREEGYLILASGSTTHNLRDFGRYAKGSKPLEYALQFDAWLENVLAENDLQSLVRYRDVAPWADKNHPTDDHFTPMLVAAGAGNIGGRKVHDEFVYGFLSLSAFIWD